MKATGIVIPKETRGNFNICECAQGALYDHLMGKELDSGQKDTLGLVIEEIKKYEDD